MKSYFLKMVNYDSFANKILLKLIFEAKEPEKPVQLMAHLLAAQQVWLNRCMHLPPVAGPLWPDWEADTFEQLIIENNKAWTAFIESLNPDDFDKEIAYNTTRGDSFSNKLEDILAHVINHGTHHRAQIGQQLKFGGLENLPLTDYILYVREH